EHAFPAHPRHRQRHVRLGQVGRTEDVRRHRLLLRRQPAGRTAAAIRADGPRRRRRTREARGRDRRAQPPRPRPSARVAFRRGRAGLRSAHGVFRNQRRDAAQALCRYAPPASAQSPGTFAGRRDLTGAAGTQGDAAGRRLGDRHQRDERAPVAPACHPRIRAGRRCGHVAAVRIVRLPPWRAAGCGFRVRCARPAESPLERDAAPVVRTRCGRARLPRRRRRRATVLPPGQRIPRHLAAAHAVRHHAQLRDRRDRLQRRPPPFGLPRGKTRRQCAREGLERSGRAPPRTGL
ncbi:MAG: RNase adapter protein RapZ, partial [uncultured Lysobacter sp.]